MLVFQVYLCIKSLSLLLPKAVKSLSFVDVGGNVTATDVANFESQVKLDAKACCVFNCEISDLLPVKCGMVDVAASQGGLS